MNFRLTKTKPRLHNAKDGAWFYTFIYIASEWIAYRQVECERLAERFHVVVARLASVVWSVNADTEIAADYKHTDIETKTDTCTKRNIIKECRSFQLASRTLWVIFK